MYNYKIRTPASGQPRIPAGAGIDESAKTGKELSSTVGCSPVPPKGLGHFGDAVITEIQIDGAGAERPHERVHIRGMVAEGIPKIGLQIRRS